MAVPLDLTRQPDVQRHDLQSSLPPHLHCNPRRHGSGPADPHQAPATRITQNPTRLETPGPFAAIILCDSARFGQSVAARTKAGSLHSVAFY